MAEKKVTLEKLAEMIARGFAGTDERFEKVDERFEKVDERFDEIDVRFERVDEEFRSVRGELGMFRNETIAELKEIKTVLGPLVRIVAGLEIDVNELRSRVARLEQRTGLSK